MNNEQLKTQMKYTEKDNMEEANDELTITDPNFTVLPEIKQNFPNVTKLRFVGCTNLRFFNVSAIEANKKIVQIELILCPNITLAPMAYKQKFPAQLERLHIEKCMNFDDGEISSLQYTNINMLSVENCPKVIGGTLYRLSKSSFTTLILKNNPNISETAFTMLPKSLIFLCVAACRNFRNRAMSKLDRLEKLKFLSLVNCNDVDGLYFNFLPPNLESLIIDSCKNFDDEFIGYLAHLKKLQQLALISLFPLTGSTFYRLPAGIKELRISKCFDFDDNGLEKLQSSKIALLEIHESFKITGSGFSSLPSTLENLILSTCPFIEDKAFAMLPQKLTRLYIDKCHYLTNNAIRYIGDNLNDLKFLAIVDCEKISGPIFNLLPFELKTLAIQSCELIDDSALTNNLSKLSNLQNLALCSLSITGSFFRFLKGTKITRLDLSGCRNINGEGILAIMLMIRNLSFLRLNRSVHIGYSTEMELLFEAFPNLKFQDVRDVYNDKGIYDIRKQLANPKIAAELEEIVTTNPKYIDDSLISFLQMFTSLQKLEIAPESCTITGSTFDKLPSSLKELRINCHTYVISEHISKLENLTNLKVLKIFIADIDKLYFAKFPMNLEELLLNTHMNENSTSRVLTRNTKPISNLTKLKKLTLMNFNLENARFPSLQSLKFVSCSFFGNSRHGKSSNNADDKSENQFLLEDMPSLKELTISSCNDVAVLIPHFPKSIEKIHIDIGKGKNTKDSIDCTTTFQDLGNLKELRISAHRNFSITAIQLLPPSLEALEIGIDYYFSDETFTLIQHLKNLKKLVITGAQNVHGTGFQFLPLGLEELTIENALAFADEGIKLLHRLTTLKKLTIKGSDKGFTASMLHNLPVSLEELVISNASGFRDISFSKIMYNALLFNSQSLVNGIQHLTNLKRLTIDRVGLPKFIIGELPVSLEELKIMTCSGITKECMKDLQFLTKLKKLSITDCYNLGGYVFNEIPENLQVLNLHGSNAIIPENIKWILTFRVNNVPPVLIEWAKRENANSGNANDKK